MSILLDLKVFVVRLRHDPAALNFILLLSVKSVECEKVFSSQTYDSAFYGLEGMICISRCCIYFE